MRKRSIENYPGSKNVPPFKPLLFNVLPKVSIFVDAFCGSGFVSASVENFVSNIIAFEAFSPTRDQLIKKFSGTVDKITFPAGYFDLSTIDAEKHNQFNLHGTTALFLDPPYMFSTRRSGSALYGVEWSDADHVEFLTTLSGKFYYSADRVDNFVILTHPQCKLYTRYLKDWKKIEFTYSTRRGVMTDTMWLNYNPDNVTLANPAYLGSDRTTRQAMQRKMNSLLSKFNKLSKHEQQLFMSKIKIK